MSVKINLKVKFIIASKTGVTFLAFILIKFWVHFFFSTPKSLLNICVKIGLSGNRRYIFAFY